LETVQGNWKNDASIVLNCDIDLREFDDTNLQLQQKIMIWEWQKSLINRPGATLTMVNPLEMIIKFSMDITKENQIKLLLHMTWLDGLEHGDCNNQQDLLKYGLKILFVLMCPHALNKKLKSLDDFLNRPTFSLDKILGMSTQQILDEIKQMGMQNKNAYYIQQAFQKIKHSPWGGCIPWDAK